MKDKKLYSLGNRTFFTTVMLLFGIILLYSFVMDKNFNIHFENSQVAIINFLLQAIISLIIFIPTIVVLLKNKLNYRKFIRLNKFKFNDLILSFISLMLIYPLLFFSTTLLVKFFRPGIDPTENILYYASLMPKKYIIIVIFVIVVIPAITEEIQFRGLYYRCYRGLGCFISAIISSFMFGLLHINLIQFSYTFFVGIFLCIILEITESIYLTMIIHAIFNLFGLASLFIYSDLYIYIIAKTNGLIKNNTFIFIYAIIAIILAILGMKTLVILAKKNNKYDVVKKLFKKNGKVYKVLLKPSFIVGAIICIIIIILPFLF